jgi:hypothetical protein
VSCEEDLGEFGRKKVVQRSDSKAAPLSGSNATDLGFPAGTAEVILVRALLLGERSDTRAQFTLYDLEQ